MMKLLASLVIGVGLFVLLLGVMVTGSTYADPLLSTCHVPGAHSSIQDAVNDPLCDTIEVGDGEFLEHIIVDRSVTINGQAKSETIIDGSSSGRVVKVEAGVSLTMSNLSIANGLSPLEPGSGWRQPGAGILIADGQLLLDRTAVINNRGGSGAGISVEDSTIIIQDSTISGNESDPGNAFYGGGGLFVNGESDATIIGSTIRDNLSQERGGGIRIAKGRLILTDTQFIDNEAGTGGGVNNSLIGYEGKGAVVIANNSSFTGNVADKGAAVYNDHASRMQLLSTTITGNQGKTSNIYNDGQFTLQESQVANHTRSGVENDYNGTLRIVQSEFRENQIDGNGGAIRNQGTVTVTKSTFIKNHAGSYGGAVENRRQLTIIDSLFKENSASTQGGAISNNDRAGRMAISGSSFIRNTAGEGAGGAIALDDGILSINSSSITDNYTKGVGGAIVNYDGMVLVSNSTISRNSAPIGGAIFSDSGSRFVIKNSTLVNNKAAEDEAFTLHAGWNYGPDFRIVNSILIAAGGANCSTHEFHSLGYNIFSDSSCDPIGSDMPDSNLVLFPLYYNNRRGLVYPLMPGSSAIDAGRADMCPGTDQRGVERPLDGDLDGSGVCDIGSYEFDPANPPDIDQVYLPAVSGK